VANISMHTPGIMSTPDGPPARDRRAAGDEPLPYVARVGRRQPGTRHGLLLDLLTFGLALGLGACAPGGGSAGPPVDATPGVGDAASGKALFSAKACNGCHRVAGEIDGGVTGPDLKGFASRPTIAGTVPNTSENVWRWLADPQRLKPGTSMPRLPLTAANLDDLTAYLETLK
jgi:cytochrome c1